MQDRTFEQIVTSYEPLIKSQIKKLHLYEQYDEYYHVGVIGLWEAYRKFEDGKGSFSTYAFYTVRGHMLMALRKELHFSDKHELQDEQTSFDLNRPDPRAAHDLDITLFELERYTKTLSPREKLWVQESVIYGNKLGEIAKEQGVSTNTVSSWRKNALKKLRKAITTFDE